MIGQAVTAIAALVDLGGPVVAILLCASVLAVALSIYKLWTFQAEGVWRSAALQGLGGDALAAKRGFLAATLHACIRARDAGVAADDLRERAIPRLETGFGRLSAGLRLLDLIAQVAPLLGLFGTVLGMISAFRALQESGASADPTILAGGIWVALVTTAAGLVVAMPASMALSWFDSKIEAHRRIADELLEEVLNPGLLDHGADASERVPHAA
ncbi:MotA/TolQ/ExbB proton channel family protein [Thalassovita mangrovi]|uniref:MotA/TolQ/ExbB proton channel family protein n=1 Tax=Thalassovita mangrovi TaxID=2692236 RepID=A0A6L8LMI2_9RHOB|nr:MotA/TolQ/ExbB proton channel family protein [Thalassovita mangrovi]MYM56226.1 MotA/TolQ/ExbB proton channel family protein [Thalassovita mangrovi]